MVGGAGPGAAIPPILFIPRITRSNPLYSGDHLCILPLLCRILTQRCATSPSTGATGPLPALRFVRQSLGLRPIGTPRELLQSRHALLQLPAPTTQSRVVAVHLTEPSTRRPALATRLAPHSTSSPPAHCSDCSTQPPLLDRRAPLALSSASYSLSLSLSLSLASSTVHTGHPAARWSRYRYSRVSPPPRQDDECIAIPCVRT